MQPERLPFDLDAIAAVFELQRRKSCPFLDDWTNASFNLTDMERHILEKLHQDISGNVNYWNEEELKMQMVSILFFVADIKVERKIRVFYERPMNAVIRNYELSLNSDCMVASPTEFNNPCTP